MNTTQIINYWQALPWNEIKLKANTHLPKFVFIVLIILLTQTFAVMTWEFFNPAQEVVSQASNRSKTQVKTPVTNTRLQDVSAFHLFGDAEKQPVIQQQVIDAPETRLRLSLKGVFASSNPKQALAIIAASKGEDKIYNIGDKVSGGALLHAVYDDRIILKRKGKLETLRLPKSKLDSRAIYTPPASKGSSPSSRAAINNVTSSRDDQEQSIHLRKMRDTLLKDPAKIWQQVRINPVMKNGAVQGYTLAHNDQKLMKALNLRKTDIITAVNGESLSDPATLYGLMASLSKQSSLELSVERNGQKQTIQLSF